LFILQIKLSRGKSILQRRFVTSNNGYTLTEVLITLGLIALGAGIVVGINLLGAKKQSALIYSATQFAADIHRGVQQARARSEEFLLEVNSSNYRIYKENGTSGAGYQPEDELIFQKNLADGVAIIASGYPAIPSDWGDPASSTDVQPVAIGDTVVLNGRGFNRDAAIIFFLEGARNYQYVCVHVFESGEAEIVRSSGAGWVEAPPG
jgi:prepilin-type N-terminal cleavage/methylation domain-containing protein